MSEGHTLTILENEPPMTPPTTSMTATDEPAMVVVSHLPSSPSLTSLSAASDHDSSSYSVSTDESTLSTRTTSTTSSSKRVDAISVRQKVQDTWRVRREERDQREIAKRGGKPKPSASSTTTSTIKPLSSQHQHQQLLLTKRGPPLGLPLLCAVVQQTWKDAFDKPKPKAKKADRPKVFPSMLSILEANALVTHVRDLQEDEEDDDDDDDDDDVVSVSDEFTLDDSMRGADSPREQAPSSSSTVSTTFSGSASNDPAVASVLSILPAGYDWNTAILQMAQSRSRAFLLLDLAAIVRRTVSWKRTYPGITFVHSVSSNANAKLLQVLLVAGVRLVTTTRSDIAHALNAKSKLKKAAPQRLCIADSTTHAGVPDSYIRELLGAKVFTMTVDGSEEVHRVVRTVQRMQARHGGNSHGIKLELVLRLHPVHVDTWMSTTEATLQALEMYPVHELSGMSIDIGSDSDNNDETLFSVTDRQAEALRVKERILKSHPYVKIHLTGFEDETFPDEWVQWWTKQQADKRVAEVSVECSFPLIATAGALCTRIIGVRANDKEQKQQLYIDDGCYGSLYQTKGELKPIPLGNYHINGAGEQESFTSTVWGPTCDGLDRVCRDIALPKLERDDWLVFPNLGCPGALGTAFNGFEPPDTAYCVLGYFK